MNRVTFGLLTFRLKRQLGPSDDTIDNRTVIWKNTFESSSSDRDRVGFLNGLER